MKLFRLTAIVILFLGLLTSCSLKKNTAASRNYMAFITRYNIYFNGDEHYKETLKEMEQKYEDDFTRNVLMHPAEAHADEKATKPQGDFKRSIEKAQKAIQIRSIKKRPKRKAGKGNDPEYKKWLQREEYNPFLHNAWMMMARSQYMNGDFLGAAATFFYIAKHFWWLPETVTEAKLWQARSYCAIDWLFEAESILTRIKESDLTNPTLTELYNFTWANYYVRSHRDAEAIPFLTKTIETSKGGQKHRLNFLLGQLYQSIGQPSDAYKAYDKVSGSSGAAYRTKFNARIKQSEVFMGEDITSEVKSLKGMTRAQSNKQYLDQIYYAIGNLYLSRGDTTQAIENYKLAAEKSSRNGIDKALSQITLGKIYYRRGEYNLAQPCYSEAIPQLPESYPDYRTLKRQSDVLDELAVYAQSIELQDSLLRLSTLTTDQKMEIIDRIIEELKKKEKEEEEAKRREDYLAEQAARGDGLNLSNSSSQAPSTFVMNTDNSWYFYNDGTRNAGRTDFQKKWGSRKLEDDWRRRNKATFSLSESYDDESTEELTDSLGNPIEPDSEAAEKVKADREAKERENDPHYHEYYLKQIPSTPEERQVALDVIRDSYYNMGILLKDKLGDFAAAEREFDMLMLRFNDNPYRLDVYNNMFLMFLRQGDNLRAEEYRKKILAEFPDSKYAEALAPADYLVRLLASDSIQANLYDRAYTAYMDNQNELVHSIYEHVSKDYPLCRIMPKFMFINALAYVSENDALKFNQQLKEIVTRYPETDVAPLASDYINLLSKGRQINPTSSNLRGMVWSTRLVADSSAVSMESESSEFVFDSIASPHIFLFLFNTDAIPVNQMVYEVARFNFSTFTVSDFDLEQMSFEKLGVVIVKGFNSLNEANRYRSMLEQSTLFTLPPDVVPLAMSQHNFDVLLSGRSLEEYFEAIGDDRIERIHRATLPADEYPSAEEMYSPSNLNDDEETTTETNKVNAETDEKPAEPKVAEPVVIDTPAVEPAVVTPPDTAASTTVKSEPKAETPKSEEPKAQTPVKPEPAKPKATPVKPTTPAVTFPEGSEGDDPLLD